MPIEDVDYLLQNSITDTFFFFVDSAKRDKNIFPTPSSYVVTFVEPYTNVYGVEIVTSTMPSTMYNVDYINNIFKYYLIWTNTNSILPVGLEDPYNIVLRLLKQLLGPCQGTCRLHEWIAVLEFQAT